MGEEHEERETSDTMSPSIVPAATQQGIAPGSELDHRHYLQRLFGEATAEYFLNPSAARGTGDTPLWYTQMTDRLGENVSAVAVWDALSEQTRALVEEVEADSYQAKSRGEESSKCLRHLSGVKLMFRHAKHHAARSAFLMEQNPLFSLENSTPARFQQQEDTTPQGVSNDHSL